MSVKISELPVATSIENTDKLCIVQSNETKQAAVSLLPQPETFAPGILMMHAGATAPAGWLLCDGAAVSRIEYAALFGAIGTTYGIGDNSTTFNLPDLRGRSPVGAGQGAGLTARSLGVTGGEETHALTVSENAPHTHIGPSHTHAGLGAPTVNYRVTSCVEGAHSALGTGSNMTHTTGAAGTGDTGISGSGSPHNTMHPFTVVNFIIKF